MKVALVSTYTHPIALGLRYISSCLKAADHDVDLILMSSKRDTTKAEWSAAALEALVQRVGDHDLVGLSVMTNTFHRACALTRRMRDAGIKAPIIWGGTHPTVAAEESIEIADMICVGEGELAMLRLLERLAVGSNPTDLAGLWFRANGPFGNRDTIRNGVAPLVHDLDSLPFPDWDLPAQWIADSEGLVRPRPENMRGAVDTLRVQTSRGCPYHCTFCNNAALQMLYKGHGRWVRQRSVDNVLAETRQLVARFPKARSVNFVDDLFFVRRDEEIEEFAAKYNAQIGLPLQMDAFPNTVTDRKVRALAKVPIELMSMGIESASEDSLKNLYQRPTPVKRIAEAIAAFKQHRLRAEYHYIVSNPFEPEKNVIETMRFIANHHRGRSVRRVFPLMFYPGTPLYERARTEGLLGVRDPAAYDFMGTSALDFAKHDYLAVWLRVVLALRDVGVPPSFAHSVIDFAIHPTVRNVLDRPWFCPTVFVGYQAMRKIWRNLLYQPFVKPFKYLRRPPRRAGCHDVAE